MNSSETFQRADTTNSLIKNSSRARNKWWFVLVSKLERSTEKGNWLLVCFCLNLVNTLDVEKSCSLCILNPVAAAIQQGRKDASILQLHLLSGSESIVRSHHLIWSLEEDRLLFPKVQPVNEESMGCWGWAVHCSPGAEHKDGKELARQGDGLGTGATVAFGPHYICPFPAAASPCAGSPSHSPMC